MRLLLSKLIVGLILFAPSLALSQVQARPQPSVNPHAKILIDFKKRVDAYVALRQKIDDGAPPLKKTEEPADIRVAQEALAARIKAGRADAKQGDVFTPAIAAELRRLMHSEVKEKGTKELIKEPTDKPPAVPFKVNGDYPKEQTVSTVPPDILRSLPSFPESAQIQYRFGGKHLILYDARSNLIMDYIFNAIP